MLCNGECCVPVHWFTVGTLLFAKSLENGGHFIWCWTRLVGCQVQRLLCAAHRFSEDIPRALWWCKQSLSAPSSFSDNWFVYVLLPSVSCWIFNYISDVVDPETETHSSWTFTNCVLGNWWHTLAKGHWTLVFLIWMYCDDTSGNLSKKWNKHNSFLFTAAGLPRTEAQKEFNIHLLSTSNIAPPLKMLDGIVEQLNTSS